ncbi:hypothetical protein QJS66_16770 [Kocuria rhizophila]|nr:hypothetical protein QJS66_16770 [Kocuria rhizophila]
MGKTYATAALRGGRRYAGRRRIAVYKPQQTGMRGDDPGRARRRPAGPRRRRPVRGAHHCGGAAATEPMAPPPAAAIDG